MGSVNRIHVFKQEVMSAETLSTRRLTEGGGVKVKYYITFSVHIKNLDC